MSSNVSSARRAQEHGHDVVESTIHDIDQTARRGTGMSLFHWLTLGSIGASIALFIAGKRELAIFIGLWPPTIQALKAASDREHQRSLM